MSRVDNQLMMNCSNDNITPTVQKLIVRGKNELLTISKINEQSKVRLKFYSFCIDRKFVSAFQTRTKFKFTVCAGGR